MENNSQYIDSLFKDSIEQMSISQDSQIWDKLKARLDADDAKIYKHKFIIAKRLAATLLLLLVIIVIIDYSNFNDKSNFLFQKKLVFSTQTNTLNPVAKSEIKFSKISLKNEVLQVKLRIPSFTNDIYTSSNISVKYENPLFPLNLSVNESIPGEPPKITGRSIRGLDKLKNQPLILQKRVEMIHFSTTSRSWEIAMFGSPVWARYYLQDDVSQAVFAQNAVQISLQGNTPDASRSSLEENETSELSFNAGMLVAHHLRNHFGFQTGVIYNCNHISMLPQKVYASADPSGNIAYKLITSSGYGYVKPNFSSDPTVGDSLYASSAHHKLQFLTIPFLIKYNISCKRFTLSPGLGVSLNILTSSSIETALQNSISRESVFITRLQGTRLFHVSAIINTEMKYALNPTWSLDLIPALNYAITPLTRNSVVKTYPYNFGIGIGINYNIK